MDLNWEDRPDVIVDMKPGWKVTTAKRLKKIITYGNLEAANVFTFSYEQHPNSGQSRLVKFQQHSADESVSLPPHTFVWENGGIGAFSNYFFRDSLSKKTFYKDINSDGLTDIIRFSGICSDDYDDHGNDVRMLVRANNGDGSFQDEKSIILPFRATCFKYDSIRFVQQDSDGRVDICFLNMVGDKEYDIMYRNNGDGTFSVDESFSMPGGYDFGDDFNGDGLTDIIRETVNGSGTGSVRVRLSNGDGTYQMASEVPKSCCVYSLKDVNGDELTDIIGLKNANSNEKRVFYSKGDGTFEYISGFEVVSCSGRADLNGDGLLDAIRIGTDIIGVSLSKGKDEYGPWLYSEVNLPGPNKYDSRSFHFAELNGDGLLDVIIVFENYSGNHGLDTAFFYLAKNDTTANRITTISNGYGATTTVSYEYLKKDQKAFFPFSMNVVSSIITSDGVNPASEKSYVDFSGALYDAENREYRGFSDLTEHHMNAGGSIYRVVEEKYYQDEFKKGKRQEQILRDQPDGAILTRTTWDWQADTQGDWAHVKLSDQYTEYDNDPVFYTDIHYEYDAANGLVTNKIAWGNAAEGIEEYFDYTDYTNDSDGQIWRKTGYTLTGYSTGPARHTTYEYETGTGNLLKEIQVCEGGSDNDCNGSYVHTYSYDDYGNLEFEWDPNTPAFEDPTVTYEYDGNTHTYVTQIINALGHTINQEWDPRYGKITWRQDPNGQEYTYQYDDFGRLEQIDRPDGGQTLYDYRVDERPICIATSIKQTDSIYIGTLTYLDGLGRIVHTARMGDPGLGGTSRFAITKTHFDEFGRKIFSSNPLFKNNPYYYDISPQDEAYSKHGTAIAYDKLDRPVSIATYDSQNGQTLTHQSYTGFSNTITDSDNCAKTEQRDHLGRIIKVLEHAEGNDITTRYEYNAAGDLIQVKNHFWTNSDPDKNRILMDYNTLGRKIYMDDPDMGQWDYQYDANDNLISQIDAKGQEIEFAYDDLNRIITKTYSTGEPTVTYSYDLATNGIGQVYSVSNTAVTSVNTAYDEVGRVTDQQKTITGAATRTSSIDYNLAGQRTRLTYPHTDASNIFYVDYQIYPGTTLLQKATGSDGTVYAEFSQYMPSGQIGTITFGNDVQTEYRYVGYSQRLLSIKTENPAGDMLQNREYTYSPAGDITVIDDLSYVETYYYSYDKLHRLTSETTSTGSIGVIPSIMQMNYDDPDHIHAISSVVRGGQTHTYVYDSNGNQTSGPDLTDPVTAPIRTLTFNADNMPIQVAHPQGGTINITYDGESKRAKKTGPSGNTYYFSDEFEVINNIETCYIFAANLRVAMVKDHSGKTFFHKDHLGSSTVMTDANGAENEKTRYMPFGGQRGSAVVTTAYKFTDQELDKESGLYNYEARLYDPALSRFISPDSIIQNIYDPQYLNA